MRSIRPISDRAPLFVITRSYGQYRIAMFDGDSYRDLVELKSPFNSLGNASLILDALREQNKPLKIQKPQELD